MQRKARTRIKAKAKAKVVLKKKIDALPVKFTIAQVGAPGPAGQKPGESGLSD